MSLIPFKDRLWRDFYAIFAQRSKSVRRTQIAIFSPSPNTRLITSLFASLITIVAALSVTAVIAHSTENAPDAVKERMDRMSAVAKGTKTIGNMLRGRSDYDADILAGAALSIATSSAPDMIDLFQEGTLEPPSEALPIILEKPDDFAQLMADLNTAASEVAAAAPGGIDVVGPLFGKVTATCRACHQTYRAAN